MNKNTTKKSLNHSSKQQQVKLAKVIADRGYCSRRDAEKLIEDGVVEVNGAVETNVATRVSENAKIKIFGKEIKVREKDDIKLWLFHKPKGVITTHKDTHDRPTVFSMLPKSMGRVISIGRLDLNSEGLLLLTNSGEFARTLELPSTGLERTYLVRVFGAFDKKIINEIEKGVVSGGIHYGKITIEFEQDEKISAYKNHWVRMTLTEGKNREIRRIFEHFDMQVSRLIRVGYGPFELGELEQGKYQEVNKDALQAFKDSLK